MDAGAEFGTSPKYCINIVRMKFNHFKRLSYNYSEVPHYIRLYMYQLDTH